MRCFVYGTLCDPDTVATVLDAFGHVGPATLEGLHRVDGEYPTLAPGSQTDGRILETEDVTALDRYEALDRDPYVRVSICHTDGRTVQTYVSDLAALDAPGEWPGEGPEHVMAYVANHAATARSPPETVG